MSPRMDVGALKCPHWPKVAGYWGIKAVIDRCDLSIPELAYSPWLQPAAMALAARPERALTIHPRS